MFDATEAVTVELPKLTKAQTIERERMVKWLEYHITRGKKEQGYPVVVTITPILAAVLLERNHDNRPISAGNANALLSDIANGRWQFNGQSITVSDTGVLLDGQHRLGQVVATGRSIRSVIVFGPKEDARFTFDIGKPKTAANFLSMKGYKYTAALSAAARLVLVYRGQGNVVSRGNERGIRPTKTELTAAVEELEGLATSVDFVAARKTKHLTGPGTLAFAHYMFRKRSTKEAADHFFIKLFEGDGLTRGNPILYCRNRLPDVRGNVNTCVELLFKCWNAHRRNEEITKLPLNGKLPKLER